MWRRPSTPFRFRFPPTTYFPPSRVVRALYARGAAAAPPTAAVVSQPLQSNRRKLTNQRQTSAKARSHKSWMQCRSPAAGSLHLKGPTVYWRYSTAKWLPHWRTDTALLMSVVYSVSVYHRLKFNTTAHKPDFDDNGYSYD